MRQTVNELMREIAKIGDGKNYPVSLLFKAGGSREFSALYEPDMASVIDGEGKTPEEALENLLAKMREAYPESVQVPLAGWELERYIMEQQSSSAIAGLINHGQYDTLYRDDTYWRLTHQAHIIIRGDRVFMFTYAGESQYQTWHVPLDDVIKLYTKTHESDNWDEPGKEI